MRIANHVSRLTIWACTLVWIGLYWGPTAAGQADDSSLTVVYTGRLFGYYRIEPDPAVEKGLPPVQNFLNTKHGPKPLLLGMGDNFGPEFGAALQLTNSPGDRCYLQPNTGMEPPRLFYKDYNRIAPKAECDNVLNFMIQAHYRAIVPGREDFLYGAWWLNRIADRLRERNDPPAPERSNGVAAAESLTLLAANLRVKVAVEKQPQEQQEVKLEPPKGICPLLLAEDVLQNREPCIDDDTPAVIDWLQRVDRLVSTSEGTTAKAWNDLHNRTIADCKIETLQLREKVLANQTKAMQSMLPPSIPQDDSKSQPSAPTQSGLSGEWNEIQKNLKQLAEADDSLATLAATGKYVKSQSKIQEGRAKDLLRARDKACDNHKNDRYSSACEYGTALLDKHFTEAAYRDRCSIEPSWSLKTAPPLEREDLKSNPKFTPLLERKELDKGRNALLWAIYESQKDVGFAEVDLPQESGSSISDTNAKKHVALVIGVIGQEVLNTVSATNASICYKPNLPPKDAVVNCVDSKPDPQLPIYRAKLRVQNPAPVIEAILSATEVIRDNKLVKGEEPEPYDFTILMAQMPKGEAEELEARLRADRAGKKSNLPEFDLILSEAQTDHASANFSLQYETKLNAARWAATPVLSPRPAYIAGTKPLVRPDSTVVIRKRDESHYVTNRSTTTDDVCWDTTDHACWDKLKSRDRSGLDRITENVSAADFIDRSRLSDSTIENPCPTGSSSAKLSPPRTALCLLLQALNNGTNLPAECLSDTGSLNSQKADSDACKVAMMQYLLKMLQARGHADVALLERRDIFLDILPAGYTDYEVCRINRPTNEGPEPNCQLRVALDRVLWKGDYHQNLMMSGKDLASTMEAASARSDQELNLLPRDTSQEWLVTYGIVTGKSPVLTRMGVRSDEFSIPHDPACKDSEEEEKPSAGGKTMYCVNGLPLQADHAYWVTTSDHLAEDKVVYSTMSGQPSHYVGKSHEFLTSTIASMVAQASSKPPDADPKRPVAAPSGQTEHPELPVKVLKAEINHQNRRIFDLDFAKVVAGYSFRQPQGGDAYVSSNFQGATDSRASATYSSELDVEGQTRMLWKGSRYSPGIQSNLQYDRSAQGNLSGNPVNGSYPLNIFTIGGFLQWNLHFPSLSAKKRSTTGPDLSAVRTMLVIAPYQFQTQLTGNYSFFPYSSPLNGQLTLHAPPVFGFAQKAGVRWEVSKGQPLFPFGKGTYVEIGGQWLNQRNVLSSVTLITPGFAPFTCQADSDVTLANCFKAKKYPVDSQTQANSAEETLSNGGLYWDAHLQKNLIKLADKSPGISLVIESQGQAFFRRGAANALSTQTLYAVPVSVALDFPIFRNFSLAPQYSVFFYGNQVVGQNLVVNTFVMTARWYYDRDSGVPLIRQMFFKGPASADQTKTARIK